MFQEVFYKMKHDIPPFALTHRISFQETNNNVALTSCKGFCFYHVF